MIAGPDFVVLTGFLGSGKTTLLRNFLAHPASADTAVIVNEIGEIGLDGAILREGSGAEVAMAMLSNGCVCCSMGSTLATTVSALLQADRGDAGPLRRIVLETSGLSKPGPVLRQLADMAEYRMRIGVVATYDAERGPHSTEFSEAAAQWAGAGTILVTKPDVVGPDRMAEAVAEAEAINPLARIIAVADRADAIERAFDLSHRPLPFKRIAERVVSQQHPKIGVLLLRLAHAVAYEDLATWLDNLAGLLGERLLRIKGLVRVAESEMPLLIQSVGTLFSAPRPFNSGEVEDGSFLVLIGRDVTSADVLTVAPNLGWTNTR